MITHIRMKNFKSWKDSGEVKLAPLTGFFGTNSSGKSSLLQMLLLLKQTIGTDKVLFFGDEDSLVNLGDFSEVIHAHQEGALLELEFGCILQNSFVVEIFDYDSLKNLTNYPIDVDSFTFDVAIQERRNRLNVENCCYTIKSDADYKIEWANKRFMYGGQYLRNGVVKSFYHLSTGTSRDDILFDFALSLENLFAKVFYLGPNRVFPERFYYWEGTHPESIGQDGEETISALLSARIDQRTTPYNGKNVPIEKRISSWLQEMELAHSFSLERTGMRRNRDYDVVIQIAADSAKVNLPDMGYGLSQFLPVLVLCYYAPEGSTLILEQPGIHLHPKVQSQLADLLIEVVNERKLQILVESHSEHLLTRIQRRIAEEKINC